MSIWRSDFSTFKLPNIRICTGKRKSRELPASAHASLTDVLVHVATKCTYACAGWPINPVSRSIGFIWQYLLISVEALTSLMPHTKPHTTSLEAPKSSLGMWMPGTPFRRKMHGMFARLFKSHFWGTSWRPKAVTKSMGPMLLGPICDREILNIPLKRIYEWNLLNVYTKWMATLYILYESHARTKYLDSLLRDVWDRELWPQLRGARQRGRKRPPQSSTSSYQPSPLCLKTERERKKHVVRSKKK